MSTPVSLRADLAPRRDRCKLDVAVALYRFFKAAKQKLNRGPIQLAYLGAVKYDVRAVIMQITLQFA
jgi:hypothetical protein